MDERSLPGWADHWLEARDPLAVLQTAAERFGDLPAFTGQIPLSYREMYRSCLILAGNLQRLGVTAGAAVVVMMGNTRQHFLSAYATLAAGGVVVAVLKKLAAEGKIKKDELTVAFITGAGPRTQEVVTDVVQPVMVQPSLESVEAALGISA